VSRILAGEALRGKRALDVGCGSGRWSRFLRDRGAEVTGIDPTPAMLETAMRLSPGVEFRRMSATEIDLPAESVDFVLSVTVIQHLQPEEQVKAAASMCRVLKPGGRLFLLDLIDHNDPGRLVFPRRPQGWINLYQEHGARLVHWEGQEYVPLIRMLTALLPSQRNKGSAVTAPSVIEDIGAKRALFLATWPVIQISYPLELLCERLMPSDWARHACFLFEKPVKRAERT
jgi:ubiquinone/menaquinone biosynthesis C-methylase UbiE